MAIYGPFFRIIISIETIMEEEKLALGHIQDICFWVLTFWLAPSSELG